MAGDVGNWPEVAYCQATLVKSFGPPYAKRDAIRLMSSIRFPGECPPPDIRYVVWVVGKRSFRASPANAGGPIRGAKRSVEGPTKANAPGGVGYANVATCCETWKVVTWNIRRVGRLVEQLRAEGQVIDDATLALTTPLMQTSPRHRVHIPVTFLTDATLLKQADRM